MIRSLTRNYAVHLFTVLRYLQCFLVCAAFSLCTYAQSQLTIEKAKERLAELSFNYRITDDVYRQKIEREVSEQANIQPKGEFETTKEFQARFAKADLLRKSLVRKYEAEKEKRKVHFLGLIRELEDAEFQKPAGVTFGPYDADTERLPVTVFVDGKSHEEVLTVPRAEARDIKENSSEAEAQALFGVGTLNTKAVDYCFAVNVLFRGRQYSSIPKIIPATSTELDRLYKDPFVLYLRKVFKDYLRGSLKGISEAFFEEEPFSGIDRDYFRSKFIVGLITPSVAGGKNILVIFRDRPDVVFRAWVYKLASAKGYPEYELRGFDPYETDPAKVRMLRIVSKKYDPKSHAL